MIKNFAKEFDNINSMLTEKINSVLYAWKKEIDLDISSLYIINKSTNNEMVCIYGQQS
ncbi:MAG: hypothetical protein PHY08_02820 [Candidatus Cloacimonetes bacterium]|nr:hypothetical protein [Candidatus Cloacimonadota bacterium]